MKYINFHFWENSNVKVTSIKLGLRCGSKGCHIPTPHFMAQIFLTHPNLASPLLQKFLIRKRILLIPFPNKYYILRWKAASSQVPQIPYRESCTANVDQWNNSGNLIVLFTVDNRTWNTPSAPVPVNSGIHRSSLSLSLCLLYLYLSHLRN